MCVYFRFSCSSHWFFCKKKIKLQSYCIIRSTQPNERTYCFRKENSFMCQLKKKKFLLHDPFHLTSIPISCYVSHPFFHFSSILFSCIPNRWWSKCTVPGFECMFYLELQWKWYAFVTKPPLNQAEHRQYCENEWKILLRIHTWNRIQEFNWEYLLFCKIKMEQKKKLKINGRWCWMLKAFHALTCQCIPFFLLLLCCIFIRVYVLVCDVLYARRIHEIVHEDENWIEN